MSMLFKRIKDWAVSITSFRTGDVLPVDGPSGTAKMPYSDLAKEVIKDSANNTVATESDLVAGSTLPIMTANGPKALPGNIIAKANEQAALTTYAQNVAHSIAPEFDPTRYYVVNESCTYEGMAFIFTSNHLGEWNPAHATISGQNALLQLTGFNYIEAVGYMMDTGRNNMGAASYHCIMTDLLPAVEGDVFYYIGDGHSLAYSAVFFNASKTVIDAEQVGLSSSFTAITCPANTAYVKFSSFAPITDPIPFAVVRKDSQLNGLRLYVDEGMADFAGDIALTNDDVLRVKSQYQMFTEYKGLMTNTGEPNGVSAYHCYITDKIKASAGDKYLYRGEGRSLGMSAVFFNSSDVVIGTAQYQSQYSYTEITCPANTAYVKFSSFNNASDPIHLSVIKKGSELEALLHDIESVSSDELKGKKWYACGDSFTHGDFTGITAPSIPSGKYAGQLPVYPYLIGNRTECEVSNIAVNGSTIAQPSDETFTNVFTKPTTGLLYTTDFSDADYITLYFGINDSHKSVPIGTIDDDDNTTFYGAWNVVLDYLTENYPAAHIGIIISNGCDTADYPTAVEAIAKKWGVHYLDLDGGVGCQTMLRCSSRNPASAAIKARRFDQQKVSATNGHPNALAHELESTFIENWLKSL